MTHKVTDETTAIVKALSSYGVPHMKICSYIGISKNCMYRHYRAILDQSQIDKVMRVGDSLYTLAINGNVTAAIWFLKTQGKELGWKETTDTAVQKESPVGKIEIQLLGDGKAEIKPEE